MFRRFRCLLLALGFPVAVAAQIAVPPALYAGSPASTEASASSLMTPDAAPRHTIALVAPAATETASKGGARAPTNRNPNGSRARPVKIGFARAVPDAQRSIDLARLAWRAV